MRAMEVFNREPDVRVFSAGQPIFAEGEPGDVMYAVLQGEVEIRRQGQVLGTVRNGGIFGEMALLDEQPRSAAAVAKSDCRVRRSASGGSPAWSSRARSWRSA